jgi:hypothetical protein
MGNGWVKIEEISLNGVPTSPPKRTRQPRAWMQHLLTT